MRRLWCGVFLLAVLPVLVAGAGGVSRAADSTGGMTLSPNPVDPGAVLQAASTATGACPPTTLVSIVVFSGPDPVSGASATAIARADGSWTTEGWRLPPDMTPGGYMVRARCEDSPAGQEREFTAALSVRLQEHGNPDVNPASAAPGGVIQVGSGGGLCTPPSGSKPVVRVRFFDSTGVQRAAAESFVFGDGRWITELRIPEISPQNASVTASCHAFSSTFAPYAVYGRTRIVVQATAVPTTTPAPTDPGSVPGPGGTPGSTSPPPVVTPPIVPVPGVDVQSLPATPLSSPIIAEPTYTG